MSPQDFRLFPQLPSELRCMIWEWCLPVRLAEEDPAFGLLDGEDGRQICAPISTTIENTKLPVIAMVCHEARSVVLREGQWLECNGTLSLHAVWVQPRRDVLHLNYTFRSFRNACRYVGQSHMLMTLLSKAREMNVQASVVAEIIYPFRLNPPVENSEGYDPWDDEYWSPDDLYTPTEEMNQLADFCHWRCKPDNIKQSLRVAMAAITLHVDSHTALPSGLFGLLGDAPIQMIDVDDLAGLSKFEAFFQQHIPVKEPGIQNLFELFKTSRFQQRVVEWKQKAEWIMIAHMWRWDRDTGKEWTAPGDKPGSAWRPYLPPDKIESLNMVHYSPNENHPWVIRARQIMPKLQPKIMLRLCTNQCDMRRGVEQDWDSYGLLHHQWHYFQYGSL